MPKKKSVKKAAQDFQRSVIELGDYCDALADSDLSDLQISIGCESAIIRLYATFERLILNALVGAINNDIQAVSKKIGVLFPAHMTDEACEYLVTGGGFFNFNGRDGLISVLNKYLPKEHYLLVAVKDARYSSHLDTLSALRNFAAHHSKYSKDAAKKAVGVKGISSSGAWLKRQNRFGNLALRLVALSRRIEAGAPY